MGASYVSRYDASSPHTRRYFRVPGLANVAAGLFSAHAEVFPGSPLTFGCLKTLLRTCGGISVQGLDGYFRHDSSPHTRRYFHHRRMGAPYP